MQYCACVCPSRPLFCGDWAVADREARPRSLFMLLWNGVAAHERVVLLASSLYLCHIGSFDDFICTCTPVNAYSRILSDRAAQHLKRTAAEMDDIGAEVRAPAFKDKRRAS